MIPIEIPEEQRVIPWVQSLMHLIQEQARVVQEQNEQIVKLKETVQELRDEITRLKSIPKRPKFRPSGTPPKGKGTSSSGSSNGPPAAPIQKVKEEIIVKPPEVPEGARFKGYATYSIQELVITPKDVIYKLEIWQAPDGSIIKATLPPEIEGSHFGVDLRAMIYGLYASGMTQPAIFWFISNMGIQISEGQVHNILMSEAEDFEKHSEEILSAGLQEAPYIRVDDTGAKHRHQNGYCTHIWGRVLCLLQNYSLQIEGKFS